MEQFVGRFTLTDFFGIFLPGSMVTLAVQFYFPFVLLPFEAFFGADSPWKPVYFVLASYALGVILQEISYHVWKVRNWRRSQSLDALPEQYRYAVESKYQKLVDSRNTAAPTADGVDVHTTVSAQSEASAAASAQITSRTIYLFVRNLPDTEQGRVPLMAALFSLCRNGICASFAIAILTGIKMAMSVGYAAGWTAIVVSIVTGGLLWIRASRFQQYVYDNACICFLKWTPNNA